MSFEPSNSIPGMSSLTEPEQTSVMGPLFEDSVWDGPPTCSITLRKPTNVYTNLVVDDYNRWLCPICPLSPDENNPRRCREQLRCKGYVVVENDDSRSLVRAQNATEYERVNEEQALAYFANPPATAFCLHVYRSSDGKTTHCNYSRLGHISKRIEKTHGSKPPLFDPSVPEGLFWLKEKMRWDNIRKKLQRYPDRDVHSGYHGTWACPKCSISLAQADPTSAWYAYARSLRLKRRGWLKHEYVPVEWCNTNGEVMQRLTYINSFGATTETGNPGYFCNNLSFADGETLGKRCDYRYGTEAEFGFSLEKKCEVCFFSE
ncbi:hypothetical protein K504DRAFT_448003 [Pleomassaria siparia CBS 279.74]|uniref:Uncharacterized protein n=1 Tax=Pleomassaria siparia CBS 279.74 TaxID=1314801 RepID=A0A6G1K0B4_9PLEO|nr:hypothetical protein K504DRAFT_448003 [Pleomassaria siparia CBS 279.74]